MTDGMITTSPDYPFDMTSWCQQKSSQAIRSLAYHAGYLIELEKSGLKTEIDLYAGLSEALYDITKIFAYFHQAKWSPSDRELILQRGYEGFEELEVKYGLREMTSNQNEAEQFRHFKETLEKLLCGSKSPNRTELHVLFRNHPKFASEKPFIEISNDLEAVTMGKETWETFTASAKKLLKDLEN
jgi:hypothetical protein